MVLAAGLAGSWALVGVVNGQQHVHAHGELDHRAQVIESAVAAEVRRYVDTTADLATSIGAQSVLSASDFTALTSNLDRSRLPGISSVSFVVPATDAEIPRLQRIWRERGSRALKLRSAGTADEHLFSVLNQPLDGSAPHIGRDFSVAVEPTQAMAASLALDRVTASLTFVAAEDEGLGIPQPRKSFFLTAPVIAGFGTPHEGRLRGWLLMEIRGGDFVKKPMEQATQNTVGVTLIDNSTRATREVPVAQVTHRRVIADPGLLRQYDLQVAGRAWQLQVQPTTAFVTSLGPSLSAPAGGAGVLLTVLLAILVGTLSSSRSRALARVDRATAALHADITRRELVEAKLHEREEELHLMALTDSLTGLANHRSFTDQLDQSHARATRQNGPLHVMFCDVDHFKTINDTYGHAAGDAVLAEVGARLRDHFRTGDIVGRLGGDEFAVICESDSADLELLVDRVGDVLATPYVVRGGLVAVTVSIGIASAQPGESATQLLERADHAMYQTKAARHVS